MSRLFSFEFESPLELCECKERLTPRYRERLIAQGLLPKEGSFGWLTYIAADERADVRVDTSFTQVYFTYRFTFKAKKEGTSLHCKFNPFTFGGWLIPAVAILMMWALGLGIGIANLHSIGEDSRYLTGLIALAVFTVLIMLTFILFECFSRRAVKRLLCRLVDARESTQ